MGSDGTERRVRADAPAGIVTVTEAEPERLERQGVTGPEGSERQNWQLDD